jgi:hypothetical protein
MHILNIATVELVYTCVCPLSEARVSSRGPGCRMRHVHRP